MKTETSSFANLAWSLFQEGRLQDALESVEHCLRENPKHPRTLLLLGRIHYQQGRYDQALEALHSLEPILGRDRGHRPGFDGELSRRLQTIITALEQLREMRQAQMDPAFFTETMAELQAEQGYLLEALDIYRRHFLSSRGEERQRLRERILLLRNRLEREGSREVPKERVIQELGALDQWIQKREGGS